MSGDFTRRSLSAAEREAEREELRKTRSRTTSDYASRLHARLPGRLGKLMKSAGLTWYGLEQRSGVSREMIGKIVRGETKKPSLSIVAQLCHGMRMNVTEFIAPLDESGPTRLGPH